MSRISEKQFERLLDKYGLSRLEIIEILEYLNFEYDNGYYVFYPKSDKIIDDFVNNFNYYYIDYTENKYDDIIDDVIIMFNTDDISVPKGITQEDISKFDKLMAQFLEELFEIMDIPFTSTYHGIYEITFEINFHNYRKFYESIFSGNSFSKDFVSVLAKLRKEGQKMLMSNLDYLTVFNFAAAHEKEQKPKISTILNFLDYSKN